MLDIDIRFIFVTLFLALMLSGCDIFSNQDERDPGEPYFSYIVYDENGELIKEVTHERIGESEVQTSLTLFGDRFTPPSIADAIETDPENLRRSVIYLHAETDLEDNQIEIINFRFPFLLEELKSGTYPVFELSADKWLNMLRNMWESFQDLRDKEFESQNFLAATNSFETEGQTINVVYHEFSGAGNEPGLKFLYQATRGTVELEYVSGVQVAGSFTIELAGLPVEIMTADEFPEDPEFRTYQIIGNFNTEYGDYSDLDQVTIWFF